MKVAIYSRVSTEEQAREGTSLEGQMDKLEAWANREGHIITGRYKDEGYSGAKDERPSLNLLMMDATNKKFDVVATTKLDRFFRNLRLMLEYEDKLRKLGIGYTAIDEGIDTTNPLVGKMFFHLLGVVAEWEREIIKERTQAGKIRTWQKGKAASGKVLYGYRWNKEKEQWEINEDEAKVVREIYRLYVDERLGMARVAVRLNQQKIPTGGWGKKGWTDARVEWILHHPAYTGKQCVNRKEIWDFDSGDISFDMPVIVDKQTHQLALKRIAMQKRVGRRNGNGDSWLLQGLIKCGECGYGYRCIKYLSGNRSYKCLGRSKIKHLDGSAKCNSKTIDAGWLETIVWDKVKACLEDSKILRESILNALDKQEQRKAELEVLCKPVNEKLANVREKMRRKGVRFEAGELVETQYHREIGELRKQEADLMMQRNDIDPQKVAELETLEGYIEWARKFWSEAELKVKDSGLVTGYDEQSIQEDGLIQGWNFEHINLATGLTSNIASGKITPRAMLERFSISLWIKGNEAEIRGLLPTQTIGFPLNSTS